MTLQDMPIRRKLMLIMLVITLVVMALMRGAFFAYEYSIFRRALVRQTATLGGILAANSTAALAFENQDDAREILAALRAEPYIDTAALYDGNGRLFARYPEAMPAGTCPPVPGPDGHRFVGSHLEVFQPVLQRDRRLGTLYLRLDSGTPLREFLWGSTQIAAGAMALVLFVAYFVSRRLQRQISQPILDLAGTARTISGQRDYSVRATKVGANELGQLTDAFNQMLDEIQLLNQDLERRVVERTAQLEAANTQLQHSRAELRSLFESIDEGYCIIEMLFDGQNRPVDYRFLTINPAFEKQTGLVNAEGRRMRELAPEHEAHWFETYGRIALTGEPARFQNHAAQLHRWFDVYAFRYGDPAKRQVAILFNNITERKQAEDRIRQLNADLLQRAAQLEAANQELEAFSYSVSHDLRAPLRHIDGFAGLLRKNAATLDDQGRRHLDTISGAARQMGRLIDDLLSFSRMGRAQIQSTEVDQDALLAAVIRENSLQKTGRPVEWRIAPLPRVQADPAMLRQVWLNLLDNAVKYTGKVPGPRIEVGHRQDVATCEQVFFVRDNGAGFDMRYVDKLFGVFQRLHGPAEFEGTGIGLANVRRIVTRLGGRTWAEGRVGAGATFYFSLPATSVHP
ncbi:MAG: HAMP domain-containing protein [Opitutae bacterium]|nr:HAMP domain-containing protein [Opitutae bacterium]